MSATAKLSPAERAEVIANLEAEIARLQAELEALKPQRCVQCWREVDADDIDREGECPDCARKPNTEVEDLRADYHASIAGGCH